MLFNINKQKSLAFLKLFVTLAIVFVPAFLNLLSLDAAVNLMFVVSAVVLLINIKANEKVNFSFTNSLSVIFIAFTVISFFWVDNRAGHFTYIIALVLVWIFGNIFKEYFTESNDDFFKRRIAYLFSISGTICAFYNFVYWITEIVPVAGKNVFDRGLGTGSFLGIFCAVSLGCTLSLFRGNSKFRKVLFSFAVVLQVFCFIMSKSFIAWIFAITYSTLFLLDKRAGVKDRKKHFLQMALVVSLYVVVLLIYLFNSENGKIFSDVCSYGAENFFGSGGGFFTASKNFSDTFNPENAGVALFPFMFASSGILGIVVCFIMLIRSLLAFVKKKSFESALGIISVFTIMFFPFGFGISSILLVVGIYVYNEYLSGSSVVSQIDKNHLKNIIIIGVTSVVIISVATILSFAKMNAHNAYTNKNYSKAYEISKIVSSIDIFDSECNRIAAASIRNDKNLSSYKKEEALEFVNDAIDNDSENVENYEEKAKIYFACGDYENSANQYRIIISKVLTKDKYNLALANVLYEIVERNEKGSSETKRAYEEIVELSQCTEDLDVKAEIGNIADKAQNYTKGDLSSEGEIIEK